VAETEAPAPEAPRAQPAADLSEIRPVSLKSPTLLAENDPYNSVRATTKVVEQPPDEHVAEKEALEKIDNPEKIGAREEVRSRLPAETHDEVQIKRPEPVKVDDGKPVLRAIPVKPEPEETPLEIRRAVPVGPMDEVDEGALLRAATPTPGQSDDQ
jgi:hypothetical protein